MSRRFFFCHQTILFNTHPPHFVLWRVFCWQAPEQRMNTQVELCFSFPPLDITDVSNKISAQGVYAIQYGGHYYSGHKKGDVGGNGNGHNNQGDKRE